MPNDLELPPNIRKDDPDSDESTGGPDDRSVAERALPRIDGPSRAPETHPLP